MKLDYLEVDYAELEEAVLALDPPKYPNLNYTGRTSCMQPTPCNVCADLQPSPEDEGGS